jgi:hypothetical protein
MRSMVFRRGHSVYSNVSQRAWLPNAGRPRMRDIEAGLFGDD